MSSLMVLAGCPRAGKFACCIDPDLFGMIKNVAGALLERRNADEYVQLILIPETQSTQPRNINNLLRCAPWGVRHNECSHSRWNV